MTSPGRRLARDGAIYALGGFLQRGLPVLLLPVLARTLGVAEVGIIGAALAIGTVLSILLSLGLNMAIVRLYYDEPVTAPRTEWAMMVRIQVGAALLLAGVLWATADQWGSAMLGGVGWEGALKASVAYGAAVSAQTVAQGLLRAARRPVAFVTVSATQVALGASIGVALSLRYGAAGYLSGLAIGSAVAAVAGLAYTYRRPWWRFAGAKAALALSLPFLGHWLATWGLNVSDRIIVERALGAAEAGRYYLAYVAGSAMFMAFDGLQSAWVPYFYGLDRKEKQRAISELVPSATAVAAALAVAIALMAPVLTQVMGAAPDRTVHMTIAIVAASAVVRPAYYLAMAATTDAKDSRPAFVASTAAAIIVIGGDILAVPRLGIVVAAIMTVIGFTVQATITYVAASRLFRLPDLSRVGLWWLGGIALVVLGGGVPDTGAGWVLRGVAMVLLIWFGWTAATRVPASLSGQSVSALP